MTVFREYKRWRKCKESALDSAPSLTQPGEHIIGLDGKPRADRQKPRYEMEAGLE